METPEQEAHLARQIRAAQTAQRLRTPNATPAADLVQDHRPKNKASDIEQLAAYLQAKINDRKCEPRILWKVATAVVEKRVPEHLILGITQSMDYATNRGAYFVAAAKRAFAKVELSWFEEEWE